MADKSTGAPLLWETLESVPRADWPTSNQVARAYLECPRIKGIVKHLMFKNRLPESYYSDVLQNAWFIVARDISSLDEPKNIYTWLYRTLQLVVFGLISTLNRTEHLRTEEEEGDEEREVKPLATFDRGTHPDHANDVIAEVDQMAAIQNFTHKLVTYSWPADIIRDGAHYIRIGRPRKSDAVEGARAEIGTSESHPG